MTNVDPVVLGALDRATLDFSTDSGVAEHLTQAAVELDAATYDPAHLDAMRAAIGFWLTADGTFSGDYAGAASAPWPRTLDQVTPAALELWAAYADAAASAPMRAHLNHLLVAAKAERAHQRARDAIDAYRAAVPDFVAADTVSTRLRAVQSLVRALGLALAMNHQDLRALVVTDIVSMVEDMLDADAQTSSLGLVYMLLEALCVPKADPAAAEPLVGRAVAASEDEIDLHRAFLGLLRALAADDQARKAIDRRTVTAMIDAAESRLTGMLSLMLLNDAATKAQQTGLTDLAELARTKMQAMRVESLGTGVTRIPLQLTVAERDAALAQVDRADSLAAALWRIAAMPAPAGTDAAAERAARMAMPNAPWAAFVARGKVNPAGPVPTAPASDDALENTKAVYRKLALQRAGLAYMEQLDRVRERFTPTVEDLVAVFACPELGSASRTRMLARAFEFYATGEDDDACVHLAVPRVESLVREILRGRGVPVLTVAQGATKGGVVQMGTLISNLAKVGFDEDRRHSLALTFTDGERGLNVRNDVCHGLVDCPARPVVSLVLQAALHLLAVAQGVIPLTAPQPAP